jgi:ketosteroid isomerase-like protein
MSIETTKALAIRFFEAMSAGQGYPDDLVTPDFKWVTPDGKAMSQAELAQLFAGLGGLLEGPLKMTMQDIVAEGNKAVIEATSHAPLKNGKTYANRYQFKVETDGKRVTRVAEYADTAHAAWAFAP